jgi:uncharacterized membrane protein YqjE
MNPDVHERARQLIDTWHVEGISTAEQEWLNGHLAECTECQAWAQADEHALRALRSNTVNLDPALVSITQARVRLRAGELREKQAHLRALWISCGLSWLMGTLTAPLVWQAMAWLGRRFDLSQAIWITLFGICWIAPATALAALLACWRSRNVTESNSRPTSH